MRFDQSPRARFVHQPILLSRERHDSQSHMRIGFIALILEQSKYEQNSHQYRSQEQ